MNFNRIAAIVLRHFYLIRGSMSRVLPLFLWVAIDVVLWGFITKYLSAVTHGFNFVTTLLGAVLLWDFFGRVMQGVTTAFFEAYGRAISSTYLRRLYPYGSTSAVLCYRA